MLSRIFQFHAFEMEPVIKVRYKPREALLLVLVSLAAAATGQPGNPRKVQYPQNILNPHLIQM